MDNLGKVRYEGMEYLLFWQELAALMLTHQNINRESAEYR